MILGLVLGQMAPNQAPGQPKQEVKTTLRHLAARNGRGFTGMLDFNEGRSGEVRKSQVGIIMERSKCTGTRNCSGSESHGITE